MSGEPWQRVLWKRQPYADNYIPPFFLQGLRRNPNFRPYRYTPVLLASCGITQHISSVFVFVAVFARLHRGALDPRLLVAVAVGCYVVGYTACEVAQSRAASSQSPSPLFFFTQAVKSALLVFLALLALSPVLRTLTAATSPDSVWALSACLFVLNALLADYAAAHPHSRPPPPPRLPSVLSTNAAISASVVLASRLATNTAVFALTLFSVLSFALFPILRVRLQSSPPPVRLTLTALLSCASVYLTAPLSRAAALLLALLLVLVTFIAPGVLIWAQRHKNEIRGPWDVAVPQVRE